MEGSAAKRARVENGTGAGVKAVIMVGGASKGTRFRPLSLDCPKPLMMVAGQPMIEHHVEACAKLPSLQEVILLGFYEPALFAAFMESCTEKYKVAMRYLQESVSLGTAGGLNRYREEIFAGNPASVIVLHCDIACSFPLQNMLDFHAERSVACTVLGKELSFEEAHKYGEMVMDSETGEMVHYAEKPQSNISPVINCGVYVFSRSVFDQMKTVADSRAAAFSGAADDIDIDAAGGAGTAAVRLEQDVLMPLAGKKMVFVFKTDGFWGQIKSPNQAIACSGLYLEYFTGVAEHAGKLATASGGGVRASFARASSSEQFDVGTVSSKLAVVGACVIAPSAKVSPSAKIGPNVSIAAGVVVGDGARLQNCLVLEDVIIKEHAFVKNAILGWNSTVGQWTRVQGSTDKPAIFGAGVTAKSEVIIDKCTVLPHKSISASCSEEIIL